MTEKKKKAVILGAGGHGKVVCDTLERRSDIAIVGFLDNSPGRWGQMHYGYPVLGGSEKLSELYKDGVVCAVAAVGHNEERKKLAANIYEAGMEALTLIHPTAYIARDVNIGAGTVIMPQAVVQAGASIGEHVIINTGAVVEHDCIIGSFSHIASGAHFGGAVVVGEGTLVGTGATVRLFAKIGSGCVIGAGAVVVKDVPDTWTVVGNPARRIEK
ncbi:MAG: hypothetical protein A3C80_00695 [Candidatus Ryanbacteria bacterium RIFCSPHIGHO2_02_FULL_45_43]|uniref:PglD N-terminal domain-containing protein n=1 Tax=Candidatus Ryanbacteria bacterium RIFCSPHIGHO2_01_45_13 TaxID=1802112 RepID=A0A1G2FX75_9BACT|nr:MAG: hypothetical protein A2718_02085 [Candidatus Ryanbacteria bacterium RIFCSPHIGHO2_01_FULL_44_130]OGZ42684.1 MAG: hypothetical protein A2W41_02980 [Candidatus Ryanbacteria bacterium RIFCSPHIGHO2_01_45_13]OGZ48828.1 MAG: hypothetical protein A3C80_00695 [Candidatus Ryanbacteria bacterium RIFCSPHIGHO2_02_FULL_45_43]OGZ50860.1 MAG: hypothetical protein A3E55_02715 [Candidatus Ryanbacteria bacterium RIFCSPHIGHO2_12_FULL_44_20]OGZ52071.1 MAG: hypothetical protein A3A17_01300 [Candidatus Ryanba